MPLEREGVRVNVNQSFQKKENDQTKTKITKQLMPKSPKEDKDDKTNCVCPHTCLVKAKIIYACLLF